jgi:pimeloyl-ACP methyl ester carboxylesterase
MNVVVNGLMTNYQKAGSGRRAVVLLPGWGDTSKTFSGLMKELVDDYTVLAVDLPGFGDSQAPDKAWGLEDYSGFVDAWLKKIGVDKVHALVGHSHGGATAVYGLGNKSLKSDKLVLLASSGIRNQEKVRKSVLMAAAKTAKLPMMLLPPGQRQKLRRRFYTAAGSELTLLPHMEETFRRIIAQDIQSSASRIDIPTLLVYGSRDKATPVRYGHILNRLIRGSRLEVVNAGHFVHLDEPAAVAKLVKNFLRD